MIVADTKVLTFFFGGGGGRGTGEMEEEGEGWKGGTHLWTRRAVGKQPVLPLLGVAPLCTSLLQADPL